MRIAYVTQTRFPTEKAHGFQIAQVCNAISALGHDVTLVAPTVGGFDGTKAKDFYGLPNLFRTAHLRQFDALNAWFVPGKLAFAVSMASYRAQLKKHFAEFHPDAFYVRSAVVLPALLPLGAPVILELHALPRTGHKAFIDLCKQCARIVCLTSPMRDELVALGMDKKKIIVEADGVSPERFENLPDPATAAKQWKLPHGKVILGYVGSLVTQDTIEKGVDQIIGAVLELKKRGQPVTAWIVGGPKEWAERYRSQALALGLTDDDIRFQDAIPAASVPSALAACDVCVYPAPASDHPFFTRDTSPLKLLEYLAAGRPTVAADIPPLHDLVDDDSVWFCEPGNPVSLADAVSDALEFSSDAMRKAEVGKGIARQHSWKGRMERILEGLVKRK